jgi:hypothetical protein
VIDLNDPDAPDLKLPGDCWRGGSEQAIAVPFHNGLVVADNQDFILHGGLVSF